MFNFDDSVYMTRAIIPKGTFTKGILGRRDCVELMAVRSLEELKRYTAVYDKNWPEWNLIETLKLKKLYHNSTQGGMYRMVAEGRVYMTFGEIPPNPEQPSTVEGITLQFVQGIKLVVPVSRHFMISKKHPQGRRVYEALKIGLAILNEQGEIMRYMKKVGVMNPIIADWVLLN